MNSRQLMILISFFLFLCCLGYALDSDGDRGSICGAGNDNSTWNNVVQSNLNNVIKNLEQNVNLHSGFYTAVAGENSDKIYGLIQCRGDVSALGCTNCTREAFKLASELCYNTKTVTIWRNWCTLRYSNESFFGEWEASSLGALSNSELDDAYVASKGLVMMGMLVNTTPEEPLMFAASEVDVGKRGKRYGITQCSGDLSRSDCGKCLDNLLAGMGTSLGHKKGWEAFSLGCSMWYNDFRFYSNFSTPTNAGSDSAQNTAGRLSTGRLAIGIITLTTMAFLLLL